MLQEDTTLAEASNEELVEELIGRATFCGLAIWHNVKTSEEDRRVMQTSDLMLGFNNLNKDCMLQVLDKLREMVEDGRIVME